MQTIISKTVNTKTCECCGRVFTPVNSMQKYCRNEDCEMGKIALQWKKNAARRRNATMLNGEYVVRCELCGKQFAAPSLHYKFCSEECRRIRSNYNNRVSYAKKAGLPAPIDPSDMLKAKTKRLEEQQSSPAPANPKPFNPIRNFERTNMNNQPKPRYSVKELEEKLDAKTKKIIDTIKALQAANIDDGVIFEAVKSINRMPLNKF